MCSFPTSRFRSALFLLTEVLYFRQKLIPQALSWGEMSGKIHVGSDYSHINLICGLARGAVYGNSDFVPILRLLSA